MVWHIVTVYFERCYINTFISSYYLVGCGVTSLMHFLCGETVLKSVACCTISPASNNPKPYLEQEGNIKAYVFVYTIRKEVLISPHTCDLEAFTVRGRLNVLMAPTWGSNKSLRKMMLSSDMIAPLSLRGWGLLCVPPVIARRMDSEQCAISRTVIKPHYSFFTTPIWVLETQWATLKRRCCLVTVWPLPSLHSLLHFTAISLRLYWIIRSHVSSLPSSSAEQPAIQCFFLSKISFTLLL